MHGIVEPVRLCDSDESGGAEGREVLCKEPLGDGGEAVHLGSLDRR